MMNDVTKDFAPEVEEFNYDPSNETIMMILNYSKSIEVIELEEQKVVINLN